MAPLKAAERSVFVERDRLPLGASGRADRRALNVQTQDVIKLHESSGTHPRVEADLVASEDSWRREPHNDKVVDRRIERDESREEPSLGGGHREIHRDRQRTLSWDAL